MLHNLTYNTFEKSDEKFVEFYFLFNSNRFGLKQIDSIYLLKNTNSLFEKDFQACFCKKKHGKGNMELQRLSFLFIILPCQNRREETYRARLTFFNSTSLKMNSFHFYSAFNLKRKEICQ